MRHPLQPGRALAIVAGSIGALVLLAAPAHGAGGATPVETAAPASPRSLDGELSYRSQIDGTSRLKCLYGYFADKTGDHGAAIRIFEDCIARWNDVYSMIGLAHIYENGVGTPRDLTKAAALMKRGAESAATGGYAALARYHWATALAEGRGVARDQVDARRWMARAADEGVPEAARALALMSPSPAPPATAEPPSR